MVVVSLLNSDAKGFWEENRLARFLDQLKTEIEFDPHRIYLAGMSRGRYGAYRLVMETPGRFAVMLVLWAASPTPYAGWSGNLPISLIHGEKGSSHPGLRIDLHGESDSEKRRLSQTNDSPRRLDTDLLRRGVDRLVDRAQAERQGVPVTQSRM